jgi:hypothetical protein
LNSPTFTGGARELTKQWLDLKCGQYFSDVNKPVSTTATQNASLDLKEFSFKQHLQERFLGIDKTNG